MLNRDKVIRGLEAHANFIRACTTNGGAECPYYNDSSSDCFSCSMMLSIDALALLKEQEPVKPSIHDDDMMRYCGNCGEIVGCEVLGPCGLNVTQFKFCPKCGRKVKWDD